MSGSSTVAEYRDYVEPVTGPRAVLPAGRAWSKKDIRDEDWRVTLDVDAIAEVSRLAQYIEHNPVQHLQRRVSDFALEACARVMAKMKSILDDGVGFAVLDRLPIDAFRIDTLLEVYWLLGQMISRPVAQKWNGLMLYDVADTGEAYSYGVRASHTRAEIVFHNDNAFGRLVPDYVGLLCRHPAAAGGVSRFCSLYSIHREMQERYPEELVRLYQPMYFDRQKEHREGDPIVSRACFFGWKGDKLRGRANTSLVRKGYELLGQPLDEPLEKALAALDTVCGDDELWFEAPLERGQMQYLNNHEVVHYRSEFRDHEEPSKRRHLYRLWHRAEGTASYDGELFEPATRRSAGDSDARRKHAD